MLLTVSFAESKYDLPLSSAESPFPRVVSESVCEVDLDPSVLFVIRGKRVSDIGLGTHEMDHSRGCTDPATLSAVEETVSDVLS